LLDRFGPWFGRGFGWGRGGGRGWGRGFGRGWGRGWCWRFFGGFGGGRGWGWWRWLASLPPEDRRTFLEEEAEFYRQRLQEIEQELAKDKGEE
jgi:hypothetical protein